MFEERERPVMVMIHPKLEFELKKRKEELENITGRPVRGGLTTYSEFAAFELESIRKSGEEINKEIFNRINPKVFEFERNGTIGQFVSYPDFKKIFILLAALNKKKDQQQINVDLSKLKGLKKNDVKIYW